MSALRVELFFDEEAGNWHYRVPVLRINGGGTSTRENTERECVSAVTFALEGDPRNHNPGAVSLSLDMNVVPAGCVQIPWYIPDLLVSKPPTDRHCRRV